MLGFSIMMWFVSIVISIVAISLSKGNIEIIHGKIFDRVEDKVEYAKKLAGPCFLISLGLCLGGIIAVVVHNNLCIIYAVAVIGLFIVVAAIWFVIINRTYTIETILK